jgi:hypothetical protein
MLAAGPRRIDVKIMSELFHFVKLTHFHNWDALNKIGSNLHILFIADRRNNWRQLYKRPPFWSQGTETSYLFLLLARFVWQKRKSITRKLPYPILFPRRIGNCSGSPYSPRPQTLTASRSGEILLNKVTAATAGQRRK